MAFRGGMGAAVGVSAVRMVSLTDTDAVGGGVLVPEPLSEMDCVKLDPDAVLVRLLRGALSVKTIEPVGLPEGGAT